jgi:hypothetical protein
LTPRDLFFEIYPGSKEKFNEKKYHDGMPDIGNFDYGFNKIAAGSYYDISPGTPTKKNLQELNS